MSHFNGLSPEVAELFAILAEECGEVVQRVGKILRHGLESVNPYNGIVNRESLEDELTDIVATVELLAKLNVLDWSRINDGLPAKFERLARPGMLHHSSILHPTPCNRCGSVVHHQINTMGSPVCADLTACLARINAPGPTR